MITETQAAKGLRYLLELQAAGNYWGAMSIPNITPRLESDEDLATIMSDVLDEGARWLGLGAGRRGENRATEFNGDLRRSLRVLFEVTDQRPQDYGYRASA